jgi:tripartite-type tricarboxylate transporter receptor subunit TctC
VLMKRAVCIAAVMALVSPGQVSHAQSHPTKPVHIVVPFTPGGLTDIMARAMVPDLTKVWGQAVIIDNRPGAGTRIGAELVAKSPPDGHTILYSDASLSFSPYLYAKLAYDPIRDFAPLLNIAQSITVLVAGPGTPAKNLQELIALAKARPGEITYGTFGVGSTTHMMTEEFTALAGIRLNHIPFKGIADVMPAVLSGQIAVALSAMPPAVPLIRSGKVKGFAFAGPQRPKVLPDLPTFHELGVPFESLGWFGLFVQAATPRPIIQKMAADIARIVGTPEYNEKYIEGAGLDPLILGPDEYAEFLKKDRAVWATRVNRVNVKLD